MVEAAREGDWRKDGEVGGLDEDGVQEGGAREGGVGKDPWLAKTCGYASFKACFLTKTVSGR